MADNVELDPGSGGSTVATDDTGAAGHVQIFKLAIAADGSATIIPADATDGLRVYDATARTSLASILTSVDGLEAALATLNAEDFATQTTLAAVLAKIIAAPATEAKQDTGNTSLAAIKTAVETLDNIVSGSEAQVDVLTLPDVTLAAATLAALETIELGATTLAALETIGLDATTLAALESITIGTALPAGTNAIGKLAANSGVDIGDVDVGGGLVAHDAADSGNPVKTGGRARTALPAAVAQDDRTDTITDKHARTLVANAPIDQRTNGKATYSNTTAADLIAAPGASIAIVVTSVLVVNGHATVDTKVEVRDGTTVKIQGYAAADGGGFQMHDPDGLFVATANAAVTGRNVTTGADTDVFVAGFKVPA